jgi:hypothetical protein
MRSGAALAAAIILTGCIVGPTTAAAPAPLCQGKEATIVAGEGQQSVVGTEGPDVIVTVSTTDIEALGGDDTICMAGGNGSMGPGDDSVLNTSGDYTSVILGPGDDRFTGGPGAEVVDWASYGGNSPGADMITTGGGDDRVGSGLGSEPNHDIADLGPGSDSITVEAYAGSDVRVVGGGGQDSLSAIGDDHRYRLNMKRGVLTRRGIRVVNMTGIEGHVVDLPGRGSLTVVGTPAADYVALEVNRFVADLGRGDDSVDLPQRVRGRAIGRVTGGRGVDAIRSYGGRNLVIDLQKGVASRGSARGTLTASLRGFEDVAGFVSNTSHTSATITGNDLANTIVTQGCPARVDGGGGSDSLFMTYDDVLECPARFDGGPGDDLLVGNLDDDVLIGGPGRDVARGAEGTDTCVAEREVSCER